MQLPFMYTPASYSQVEEESFAVEMGQRCQIWVVRPFLCIPLANWQARRMLDCKIRLGLAHLQHSNPQNLHSISYLLLEIP